MREDYLLPSPTSRRLYGQVKDLPIYDYHCHLSPREIWEDCPLDNIGRLWLEGDHYKWRLMRAVGISEEFITGPADWREKFFAYARAVSTAAGNPLYHWTRMELSRYFGIDTPLSPETAAEIWETANRVIRQERLSPRKLISESRVRYLATTDDPAQDLPYHRKLREEPDFKTRVAPAFRADGVLLLNRRDYPAYMQSLAKISETDIRGLSTLEEALVRRLDDFAEEGCRFADVGIPYFPHGPGSREAAERAFQAALLGREIADADFDAFLWQMYRFLGEQYRKRNLVMQWHLAVCRNVNTALYQEVGPDSGGDCIGDVLPGSRIAAMLDAIQRDGDLPETILYTLNPAMLPQLCAVAGSFPRVRVGAAWWFNDHKRGIEETLRMVAEIHHIGSFLGMLTDSRSFLSYARHDYFRRILCGVLADWEDKGEFCGDTVALAEALCCGNIRRMIEEK